MKPKKLYLPTMICPVCESRTGFWKRQAKWVVDGDRIQSMGRRSGVAVTMHIIQALFCGMTGWLPKRAATILVCQECNTQVEVG